MPSRGPDHLELSGLDSDDEDEDLARPRSAAPEKRPPRTPPRRPPPLPHAGDAFSDSATRVAPPPRPPSSESVYTVDASLTTQAHGAVEVTIRREKSDRPEPTISVDADLWLDDLSIITEEEGPGPSQATLQLPPHAAPLPDETRQQALPGVALESPGDRPTVRPGLMLRSQEATRLTVLPARETTLPMAGSASGTLVAVGAVHMSGALPLPDRPGLAEGGREETRIVTSLKLLELDQPRARRSTNQQIPAVVPPGHGDRSGPTALTSLSGLQKGEAPAEDTLLGQDPGKKGRPKKKPVTGVKARSKVKVTPIDPARLLSQKEAAERKAGDEKTGLHRFFEKSGLHLLTGGGLDEDGPAESTMIGRFLGKGREESDPTGQDGFEEVWKAVQDAPFLEALNPQFLTEAIRAGDLQLISVGRDILLDTAGRAILVRDGQLALAKFKPDVLDKERRAQKGLRPGDKKAEKREIKRRQQVGPLIRLCKTNLALFSEGDLIALEPITSATSESAVYTVTPAKVLSIARSRLESWRRTYHFFGDRMRRAADAARNRIAANSGARSMVADFFVRHGLSVSMSLRVRELDKCIECYECEKACADRYGVKRLSLNGKVLGALDFVDCCHTCVDQRCIDPCAFDAIRFDTEKKEVLILEEACTGCTLCAAACPYDAIEMHELDEKPLLRLRLEREDKLGFGAGKERKAKLRRIASKCDHCIGYEDQACISACPTGALLEIPPEAAFTERTESIVEAAKGGFERTAMVDAAQLFNPKKFIQGLHARDDKARAVENRLHIGWLWVVGLLAFLGCLGEIALRYFLPGSSLLFYHHTLVEGLDADVALQNIDFRPGSDFSLWLGWIGSVIMFSSTFYSARKWVPGLKRLGAQRAWFDYHVWAGTIGPLFVLLHTAAKLDNWVSLAVWSMVATVLSGLIGRYISTEIPDLASHAALQVLDIDRQLAEIRAKHAGVNVADRFYSVLRKRYAQVNTPDLSGVAAGWMALTLLMRDEFARVLRVPLLHMRLSGIKDRKVRRQVAKLSSRLALLERRRVLLPRLEPLFREWKTIHVPFAIVLSLLASVHIVIELMR